MKIGCDLTDVERIRKAASREAFLHHVYTPEELAAAGGDPQRLAGFYAAKEAFSKAMGCGLSGVELREVEVCHLPSGAPYLRLSGKTAARFGAVKTQLSISHERTMAMATVLVEDRS